MYIVAVNVGEIACNEGADLLTLRHVTSTSMPWRAASPRVFSVPVIENKMRSFSQFYKDKDAVELVQFL